MPNFSIINDDRTWFAYLPATSQEAMTFPVQAQRRGPAVLYYTVVNKLAHRYSVMINEQPVAAGVDVGADGEHKESVTIAAGLLRAGADGNRVSIEIRSEGAICFTDIAARIQGRNGADAEDVVISDRVGFELAPSTTAKHFQLFLPTTSDLNGEAQLEFTISQEQPRLKYTMRVNGDTVKSGPVPPTVGSYDVLEILSGTVFDAASAANLFTIDLEYGGKHLYCSELVAWWQGP